MESQTIEKYEKIREELNQKYYITDKIIEEYKYPYEAGDGHTETAIEMGKAEFMTIWQFKCLTNNEFNNSIILSITNKLKVILIYSEGSLYQIYSDRENNKVMSDYWIINTLPI